MFKLRAQGDKDHEGGKSQNLAMRRVIPATMIAVRTTRAITAGYLRDLDREASGGSMRMTLGGEIAVKWL
ncbi:MAG: hypothetical protein ACLFRL_06510 [Desulfohalobiaceae bacterium]